VGRFDEAGWCGEERKISAETRKILHRQDLAVSATVVRVPVFRGHAEAVMVEMHRPLSVERAREVMACFPGLAVWDRPSEGVYPTPIDVAGRDIVLVGRVREDPDFPRCLHFWVVGDNLRKGAALNAVQVAEELLALSSPERGGAGGESW